MTRSRWIQFALVAGAAAATARGAEQRNMDGTTEEKHFRVFDEPKSGGRRNLGTLTILPDGRVRTQAATPQFANFMRSLEKSVNAESAFYLPAAPGNENPRANVSRVIKRGDPGFIDELLARLRRRFHLEAEITR
jgi:hypothetical protein